MWLGEESGSETNFWFSELITQPGYDIHSSPWVVDGPNRNRWWTTGFTVLNRMVVVFTVRKLWSNIWQPRGVAAGSAREGDGWNHEITWIPKFSQEKLGTFEGLWNFGPYLISTIKNHWMLTKVGSFFDPTPSWVSFLRRAGIRTFLLVRACHACW